MLQSMTGYGKCVVPFANKKIIAEIKSLNSKQMDISAKVQNIFRDKEIDIRNLISERLVHGKVDFSLYIDNAGQSDSVQINAEAFRTYRQTLSAMAVENGIAEPQDWFSVLLRIPDVMKTESVELTDDEWNEARKAIEGAIEQLQEFRNQEGAGLEKFFTTKLDNIAALLAEVPQYERARIDKIKARLEDNLKELEDKIKFDPNRLEQELIFYIEKLDISEEKQRLTNHIKYFREVMANENAQGKKLGFIAQEMGREINTLGSKSNHSEMQIIVVKMKDELEQIKEQVLNVL
ncbi:MAG: YicC family protein [Paludibacteraceae bacterium]|nr:YicC family protein [Paludibacteraceae bacterium]